MEKSRATAIENSTHNVYKLNKERSLWKLLKVFHEEEREYFYFDKFAS